MHNFGMKVIWKLGRANAYEFKKLWKTDGIAGIAFAGHGYKYEHSFKADSVGGASVAPADVSPPYKLSIIRAYHCWSALQVYGKDRTTPMGRWQDHISRRGFFTGFTTGFNALKLFVPGTFEEQDPD